MLDLKTPEGVAAYMREATSKQDWNNRCDKVKERNDGYPDFWYMTVIASGLLGETKTIRGW